MPFASSDGYSLICLIGGDNLLYGALSYVLEREVCSRCVILRDGSQLPAKETQQASGKLLFLIDCAGRNVGNELSTITAGGFVPEETTTKAFFNMQRGTGIEKRAFNKGVRGFFYKDDSLDQMLKGLRALSQGEIWMSRDILVKVALQGRTKAVRSVHRKGDLTGRELEILALLSIGSSNDDIAVKLFISPNTVKTHLYRVFRKIKVPNRFQAALWAAKNL